MSDDNLVSISSLVSNVDTIPIIPYPRRIPPYIFNGEISSDNTSFNRCVQYVHDSPPDSTPIVAYDYICDLMMVNQERHLICREANLLLRIRMEKSEWNEPMKDTHHRSELYIHLLTGFNDTLECQMDPFIDIITDYVGSERYIPYINIAREWIANNIMSVWMLDLILEYSYGTDILRLMKVPSHDYLSQLGDASVYYPFMEANGQLIDAFNLSDGDTIPICALNFCDIKLRILPAMIQDGIYRIQPIPKVFFSSCVATRSAFILNNNTIKKIIKTSGRIPSIQCQWGWGMLQPERSINSSSSSLHESFSVQYCKICQKETTICGICEYRDVLFCLAHSAVINKRPYDKDIIICYNCEKRWIGRVN